MPEQIEVAEPAEPPLCSPQSDFPEPPLGDLMLAAAPLLPAAHVTIYGRGTLPLLLTLNRGGCAEATSVRFDAPGGDGEIVSLAWIANLTTEAELDKALHRACHGLEKDGRLVVDATAFRKGRTLSHLLKHLTDLGLRVARLLPSQDHLIVVASRAMPLGVAVA